MPVRHFLASFYQHLVPWAWRAYHRPLLMGVLLSLFTSIYLIADVVVINRSALPLLWQLQRDNLSGVSTFGYLIKQLSIGLGCDLITAGRLLMVTCHALITALLLLMAKRLFFSKMSRWALIFLLLFNPSYDDFRTYLIVEPLFWCCWLLAIYSLLVFYRSHTVLAIGLWFVIFLVATQLTLVAWLWLLLFPFGALFWKPWRRKSVAYALLGYAIIVAGLVLFPFGEGDTLAQSFVRILIENPNSLADVLGLNQSNWIKEENSFMAGVFVFSGATSLVLIRTLIAFGVACTGLAAYAWWRRQYRIVDTEHLRILTYIVIFDLFISVILFVLDKDSGSLAPFSVSLLLFLPAALGLSYLFKHMLAGHYSRLSVLVIVWCLVAYVASSMIIFGPRRGYLYDAGRFAQQQLRDMPLYSNDRLFLYYAGDETGISTDWETLQVAAQEHRFYFAVAKHRRRPVASGLEKYQPIARFHNPRGDSLLIYQFNAAKPAHH